MVVDDVKGLFYKGFIFSSLFFVVWLIIDFTFNLAGFQSIEWSLALPIAAIPVGGMFFYLAGKRVGWIVNFLYYLFFTLAFALGLYTELTTGGCFTDSGASWRLLVFLVIALVCTVFLLSNELRRYFRIDNVLIFSLGILTVSVLIILFLFLT